MRLETVLPLSLVAAVALASLGCGGVSVCTAGRQVDCSCPGGGMGVQVCNADGSAFDACQCGGATSSGTGGMGGSGGMGGTGGMGGSGGQTGGGGHGGTGGQNTFCVPGSTKSCYDGPAGTEGVGICKAGLQTCNADGSAYGPCAGEILPSVDDCATAADEDCNGAPTPCVSSGPWSKRFGVAGTPTTGFRVAVDASGNIVVLTTKNNGSLGAMKLDPGGSLLWWKDFTDTGQWGEVAVDPSGNVLLYGSFINTIDFGGGPIASATVLAFVAKLDPQGTFVWNKTVPGVSGGSGGIAADPQGNVIIGGRFYGQVNFGGATFTPFNGNGDIYLAKFDAAGAHVWSKQGNVQGGGTVQKLVAEPSGDLIATGWFAQNLDLGGGNPVPGKGGNDIFVARLTAGGAPVFVKGFGDAQSQVECRGAVDGSGDVLVAGYFDGTLDFGGGPLIAAPTSLYAAKLDAMGNHVWSQSFLGNGAIDSYGVAADAAGQAFLTGAFKNQLNLGGGTLTSAGTDDVLAGKFTAAGNHVWSKRFGDAQPQFAFDVAVNALGAPILVGNFSGTIDFGTGPLTAVANNDMFVAQLAP